MLPDRADRRNRGFAAGIGPRMGWLDRLTQIQHLALAVLLGFALVAMAALAFLSGRGGKEAYDPEHPRGPIEHYGGWIREARGTVPLFMKVWIVAVASWAIALTGIVIWHGYRY